jgi:hypothetical protein
MDNYLGFRGSWRDGWVMYDGTIVVLYRKPGKDGDAYFTRKSNYGLNVQVCVHLTCSALFNLSFRLETHPQTFELLIFPME